ncbi:hypothetical protein C8F04DRAFT_1116720 [Mycena alexandri]|uniref:Uncharacterized protein n=1 Tax=Mycena alexandri TaxID=1745969 RepID=A0AAD6SKR2_9AGAR|nr:hypothetical protein C8F04DRAFT_1116720 [Mycena alexandri]
MSIDDIGALLNAFAAVDISHLRSLCCDRYHPSLFQAVRTIRDLTLIADAKYISISKIYPEGMTPVLTSSLQNLSLNVDRLVSLSSFISRLGNFSTAIALKRISITVCSDFSGTAFWQHTDSLLSAAPAVEEISFNLRRGISRISPEGTLREYLPVIDAKGILKITLLNRDLRLQ